MMMNFNTWGGLGFGHHIHLFFGLLLIIGVLLLVAWLIKFSKKETLRNWMIGLLAIGLLGWFISAPMSMFGNWGSGMSSFGFGPSMMSNEMFTCMQDEECHEQMEEFMHEMMGLEHEE